MIVLDYNNRLIINIADFVSSVVTALVIVFLFSFEVQVVIIMCSDLDMMSYINTHTHTHTMTCPQLVTSHMTFGVIAHDLICTFIHGLSAICCQ